MTDQDKLYRIHEQLRKFLRPGGRDEFNLRHSQREYLDINNDTVQYWHRQISFLVVYHTDNKTHTTGMHMSGKVGSLKIIQPGGAFYMLTFDSVDELNTFVGRIGSARTLMRRANILRAVRLALESS